MKTLLTGAVVVTCDERHAIHAPGDVLIENDRLAYVGPRYEGPYDVRLPLPGKLLMPGLINAHTHSGMTLMRTMADDDDLMVFLRERVWPREVNLQEEDVYDGARLAAVEMLKGGVTTYVDMYFFEDALVRAALDTGARALITPTVIATPEWEAILGTWEQQLAHGLEYCREHRSLSGRIHFGLGPHAPYTLPLGALAEIAREAVRHDLPVNIHLVETAGEREAFNERGLGSTVAALQDISFFDAQVIAAHSIWVDHGDAEIYHRHNVGVASCPQSNAKLGAGIAPLASLLAAGVHVGLGTDGAATNNNLDLWEELRLAPLLAKVTALDPKPLPAPEALWLATRVSALAVHLPEIGTLAPGQKADLIALNREDVSMVPIFSPQTYISHLVYNAGRELVEHVWVDGVQVVKDREMLTVDEAEVRDAVQRAAVGLADRVAV